MRPVEMLFGSTIEFASSSDTVIGETKHTLLEQIHESDLWIGVDGSDENFIFMVANI